MKPTLTRFLVSKMERVIRPKRLDNLKYEFTFLTQLPLDPLTVNYHNPSCLEPKSTDFKLTFLKQLGEKETHIPSSSIKTGCFSLVTPEPMPFPKLLHCAPEALKLIELDQEEAVLPDSNFTRYLSGNAIIPGTHPWAHCYAGHQFGYFAGRLGDGRAMSLGEIVNSNKERWELQLKGCGETPYSRMGDGFAVVRSSVREYLCSEASFALRIPTTRAISLIKTSQLVHREKIEPGAVVARLSPSWVRFGSFEWFRLTKDVEGLKCLANYVLRNHFSELLIGPEESSYLKLFQDVARKTGKLFAIWQSYGFCHGVLNTDNMSILGLSLDYGPFGFMDKFDPSWTPNLSDDQSRYSYENQPAIGAWNVAKLGLALQPLISPGFDLPDIRLEIEPEVYPLEVLEGVNCFWISFRSTYSDLMRQKLGLDDWLQDDSDLLLSPLLNLLEEDEVDYSRFFRMLSRNADSLISNSTPTIKFLIEQLQPGPNSLSFKKSTIEESRWSDWFTEYSVRLSKNVKPASNSMLNSNPRFVLRNWIAQEAIDAVEGTTMDQNTFNAIFDLLTVFPFSEDSDIDWNKYPHISPELTSKYSGPVPDSYSSIKCSCSS